jgi:hypothetical protein
MSALRRLGPALLLLPLAPIVAEFLLGDFSIRQIGLVLALLPMYGGGALLIREIARRTDGGWPRIVLLAVAYALIEEAFLTQSLFNPNYVGQRLLDYGYVPWLGTSLNWAFFVLTIHVVWSVATPILIVEGLAAGRRTQPWLMKTGMAVTTVLFLIGCASTAFFSLQASPFVASRSQFVASGILVALAVAAAFATRRGSDAAARLTAAAPRPLIVFFVCLALAAVFMIAEDRTQPLVPAVVSLLFRVALTAAAAALLARWARARDWGAGHYLAIASATTLTYAVFGFLAFLRGHTNLGAPTGTVDLAGQVGLAALVFLLIWIGRRSRGMSA